MFVGLPKPPPNPLGLPNAEVATGAAAGTGAFEMTVLPDVDDDEPKPPAPNPAPVVAGIVVVVLVALVDPPTAGVDVATVEVLPKLAEVVLVEVEDPNPPLVATGVGWAPIEELPKLVDVVDVDTGVVEAVGAAAGAATGAFRPKKLVNPKLDVAPPATVGAAVGGVGIKKMGCPN